MRLVQRVLDAATNRALEAARVLEDVARFGLDDADVARAFKQMRHEVAAAVDGASHAARIGARDVEGDVGVPIEGARESTRRGLADVVRANGSRLGEALRSLEEMLKVTGDDAWSRVEALRYRSYSLVGQLLERLRPVTARQWGVCLVLTESLCVRPWQDVADGALAGGVSCIQLREKGSTTDAMLARTELLLAKAAKFNATIIVNDRIDVAIAAGAHGVHLGRDDLPIRSARAIAGGTLIIGATVHDQSEAEAAVADGADYCGVGAMFATSVKPDRIPAGPAWLRDFVARHPQVPHLAIGGIHAAHAAQLRAVGCRGIAVSSALCRAEDPESAARELSALFPCPHD
ncbi:MAG: thiamine phosphate synthase [Planctomycetes bacterium]|nr:thiamine phosphate synthase [Planctomycetota bacterium]